MSSSEFCLNIFDIYRVDYGRFGAGFGIGAIRLVIALIFLVNSFLLVLWIKRQQYRAESGNNIAAKSVIFPVYVHVLWANVLMNVYISTVFLFVHVPINGHYSIASAVIFALMCLFQHFVSEGVAFLLMEKGMGWHSAMQCFKKAALWAIFTFFTRFTQYYSKDTTFGFAIYLVWNVIVLLFYGCVWLAPEHRLFRRPAAYFYAKFWFFYRLVAIVAIILQYEPGTGALGNCMYAFGSVMVFAIFEPAVTYYTLLEDCNWWQGVSLGGRVSRRVSRKQSSLSINAPLAGTDLSLDTAQKLATTMDQLGGDGVALLNFAYIKMNTKRLLGQGSFSKVYLGTYRLRPVALKLIYTVDLNVETIARAAVEVELLSSIHSPNVVKIYGLSVLPPSVVILLELCKYGSLGDVLRGKDVYIQERNEIFLSGRMELTALDHLHLAIGCSRGIAALHEHAGVCHRDVKSFNFLIDRNLDVKLADLELGVTKSAVSSFLKQREVDGPSCWDRGLFCLGGPVAGGSQIPRTQSEDTGIGLTSPSSPGPDGGDPPRRLVSSDVTPMNDAGGLLANWAAPEFIRTEHYSQESDVYSLGLVLWEIVSKQLPFDALTQHQDRLRRQIVKGMRPRIPEDTPQWLSQLISSMWQDELYKRPSAADVVKTLEWHYFSYCYGALSTVSDSGSDSDSYTKTNVWSNEVPTESPVPHPLPRTASKGTGHDSTADSMAAIVLPSLRPKTPLVESVTKDSFWDSLLTQHREPQFVGCSVTPLCAVFSSSAPFYCLNATPAFVREFGLKPLAPAPSCSNDNSHLLALMVTTGSEKPGVDNSGGVGVDTTDVEAENLAQQRLIQAIQTHMLHHTLCHLHPLNISSSSSSTSSSSSSNSATKPYSIHCFPLNTKTCPKLPQQSGTDTWMGTVNSMGSSGSTTISPMFITRTPSPAPAPGLGLGTSGSQQSTAAAVHSSAAVVIVSFTEITQSLNPKPPLVSRSTGVDIEEGNFGFDISPNIASVNISNNDV